MMALARSEWQPQIDFAEQRIPTRALYERIAEELARHYGVSVKSILGPCRFADVVLARHHGWFRLRDEHDRSWSDIGRAVGCDHSSVMVGAKRFARAAGLVDWRG